MKRAEYAECIQEIIKRGCCVEFRAAPTLASRLGRNDLEQHLEVEIEDI